MRIGTAALKRGGVISFASNEQLVDHMRANGIEVKDVRKAGCLVDNDVQYAREKAYGQWNAYNNKRKATQEQRDELIKKVIGKQYEHAGTDIINIGPSLFLIDHSSSDEIKSEYANWNIPDGEGYGIR